MKTRPCRARHVWWIRRVGPSHTPNIELHGGQGRHLQIIGGFFYAPFQAAFRTKPCRQCAGAGLPSGSLRLDLYTTVGQSRRPHTLGWCQDQGAFFTHYPVSSLDATNSFAPSVACSSGSGSAPCGATSPIKARVICWAMAPHLTSDDLDTITVNGQRFQTGVQHRT